MIPEYKIQPEKITLQDCPLDIYYEGHRINGKFTFEELVGLYYNVKKYQLYLGDKYRVNIYQLLGIKNEKVFSLCPIHHQNIYDNPDYLYIFSIPKGLELSDCLIPGQIWYRLDYWGRLFQVVPSVFDSKLISNTRD